MANFTISPNMNLVVPTPGQDPGPDYATNNSNSLNIIDGHNHSSGSGVQINPNGININSDLPMNANNLTLVNTVRFNNLSGTLAGSAPNLGCIYEANNELIYNDGAGNIVPITKTGSVNAGAGSITGLPSGTASASYNSGNQTFVWQSATATPANMDGGSFIFRDVSASSKGVTVSAPPALAADLQMFWPPALPATTSIATIDTSGNIATFPASAPANNSYVTVSSSGVLALTPSGFNYVVSSSCGTFTTSSNIAVQVTNMSVPITTTRGRPIMIGFMPDINAPTTPAFIGGTNASTGSEAIWVIEKGGVQIFTYRQTQSSSTNSTMQAPPGILSAIDVVGAGTYTYTLFVAAGGVSTATATSIVMYAYEL